MKMKTSLTKKNVARYYKLINTMAESAYMNEIRSRAKKSIQLSKKQRGYLKFNCILFTNAFFETENLD